MASVGTAYVDVRADLKGFDDEVDRAGKGLVSKFGSFAKIAGKALAIGVAAGFAGGAVLGKVAISAASDLNESMTKTQVVFGDASDSVIAFSKTTAKALGQSQRQSLEAAGTFGNLFRALNIGQKPAADMSKSLVTLAGDLASFNNTDPAEALEAIRSGLVGEQEPLRKFGVNITEATLQAKALELGLISNTKKALNPAAKAQAAYALIMEQTTLAQGDFARTSGGLANQQRILKAQLDDLVANLGQQLLPVAVELANFASKTLLPLLANLLPKAIDATKAAFGFLADSFDAILGGFQNPDATIGKSVGVWEGLMLRLGAAARRVVDWFQRNWPTIRDTVETVLGAVGKAAQWVYEEVLKRLLAGAGEVKDFIVKNWPAIRDTAEDVFGRVRDAIAAVVDFVRDHWGEVQAKIQAFADWLQAHDWAADFDKIKVSFQGIVDWFNQSALPAIQQAWQWLQDKSQELALYVAERWDDIKKAVDNVVTYLKLLLLEFFGPIIFVWQNAHDQILQIVSIVWGQIKDTVHLALEQLKNILDIALGILSLDWGRAWDGLKGIVTDSLEFMKGTVGRGIDAIKALIGGGLEVVKGLFGLAWEAVRGAIGAAWDRIHDAIVAAWGKIEDFVRSLAGKVTDALAGFFGAVFGPLVAPFVAAAGVIIGHLQQILDKIAAVKNAATLGALGSGDVANRIATDPNFGHAAGTLTTGPEVALIGEAGTEALLNNNQAARALWNIANMPAVPAATGAGGDTYQFNLTSNEVVDADDIYDVFRRGELLRGRR